MTNLQFVVALATFTAASVGGLAELEAFAKAQPASAATCHTIRNDIIISGPNALHFADVTECSTYGILVKKTIVIVG